MLKFFILKALDKLIRFAVYQTSVYVMCSCLNNSKVKYRRNPFFSETKSRRHCCTLQKLNENIRHCRSKILISHHNRRDMLISVSNNQEVRKVQKAMIDRLKIALKCTGKILSNIEKQQMINFLSLCEPQKRLDMGHILRSIHAHFILYGRIFVNFE